MLLNQKKPSLEAYGSDTTFLKKFGKQFNHSELVHKHIKKISVIVCLYFLSKARGNDLLYLKNQQGLQLLILHSLQTHSYIMPSCLYDLMLSISFSLFLIMKKSVHAVVRNWNQ